MAVLFFYLPFFAQVAEDGKEVLEEDGVLDVRKGGAGMERKVELLSPAGSFEALKAALGAGPMRYT